MECGGGYPGESACHMFLLFFFLKKLREFFERKREGRLTAIFCVCLLLVD